MILSRRWRYRVDKGLSTCPCPCPRGLAWCPFSGYIDPWFPSSLGSCRTALCVAIYLRPSPFTSEPCRGKKPDCLGSLCHSGHQSLSTIIRLQLLRSVWPWVTMLFNTDQWNNNETFWFPTTPSGPAATCHVACTSLAPFTSIKYRSSFITRLWAWSVAKLKAAFSV